MALLIPLVMMIEAGVGHKSEGDRCVSRECVGCRVPLLCEIHELRNLLLRMRHSQAQLIFAAHITSQPLTACEISREIFHLWGEFVLFHDLVIEFPVVINIGRRLLRQESP